MTIRGGGDPAVPHGFQTALKRSWLRSSRNVRAGYAQQVAAYPLRPVKIIVGQAAGSASDIVARLIAQA